MERIFIILCFALFSEPAWAAEQMGYVFGDEVTGTARVLDGHTYLIDGQRWRELGVSVPEMSEARGPMARVAMDALVAGKAITCTFYEYDLNKQPVGRCMSADGRSLAMEMLRSGHAFVHRLYATDDLYESYDGAEIEARAAGRGFWASGNNPDATPAWVQAIGTILAVLVAVVIAAWEHWRTENRIRREQNLKARSLALALYLPLIEVRAKTFGIEFFWSDFVGILAVGRQTQNLLRGQITLPEVLEKNVSNMYLLDEAGHDIQQMIAVIQQYNRMVQEAVQESIENSRQLPVQALLDHVDVMKNCIERAIAAIGPIHDGDTI